MLVATDDPQVFRVSFRDQTEEIEAWLTQAEVIEQSEYRPDSWLFVDDDIWDETLLLDRSLPHDCKVTFIPRDVSQTTYMVYYSDACGGSQYFWTKGQIVEQANHAHPGSWVFVDDQLSTVLMIAEYGFQKDTIARFTPRLVGHRCTEGQGVQFTVNLDGQINEYTGKEIRTLLDAGNNLFLNGAPATYGQFHEYYKESDPRSIEIVAKVVTLIDTEGGTRVARWSDCSSIIRNASGEFLCLFDKMVVRDGDQTSVEPNFEALHVGHALGNIPNVRLFCLP